MASPVPDIIQELKEAEQNALTELSAASDRASLEAFRGKYLGKKSVLQKALSSLGSLSPEERKALGMEVNRLKRGLEETFQKRQSEVENPEQTTSGSFDPTLPGIKPWVGHKHPLTLVMDEIKSIFREMGFQTAYGPEVEDDWHNFEALNTPPYHPARDMQDTFYLSEKTLLRTHTSPVQIRYMEKNPPPIRIIAPGRSYRKDELDMTHSPVFHQVEGLAVDEDISFADLKGTLSCFVEKLFGSGTASKFRPSFFPFTEPSAELDMQCIFCKGKGCNVCKRTGWLELGGCGMVDPNVFVAVKTDPEQYTGFAFGMGIERIAMLKYGINDIRLFYENDKRFLEQF